jgi:hypothetical protein
MLTSKTFTQNESLLSDMRGTGLILDMSPSWNSFRNNASVFLHQAYNLGSHLQERPDSSRYLLDRYTSKLHQHC